MSYPVSYKMLSPGHWSVYLSGAFIGEVRLINEAWFFRTFGDDPFVSSIPAPTRYFAIIQWPGFHYMTG